jgi:3-hydroxyisobutyrate dehydrogenase
MASLTIAAGKTRIGWIGTGVMGVSMCGRLMDAGFAATVTTRTRAKATGLLERGAVWADTPAEVARASDVVFSMLGFPDDVREVALGPQGVLGACAAGSVIVDMTTSRPELAREIARAALERAVHAVDAPVSGGDVGAREGRLSIMIGGDAEVVAALEPCWHAMGQTIVRQGGPGAGQHTKMVNQTLIASALIGVCEGLLYAQHAGLDPQRVLESVASGAAGSWQLSGLGPRILEGDFRPGFYVEHFIKDMSIALEEAGRLGLELPGLALARQLFEELRDQGHARSGTQSLILALARRSGVEWPTD